MLWAELKRILKTRSTWWLAALALMICLLVAVSTVLQVTQYVEQADGSVEIVKGVGVYREKQARYAAIRGEVTPELIALAVETHHRLLEQYGSDYSIPPEISDQVLGPYSPVFTWIYQAFTDDTGAILTSADITPEQARNYYAERVGTLERTLREQYEQTPQVMAYVLPRLEAEGANFTYSYGIGSTYTYTNLGLCTFLVTLLSVVLTAPIFSSDYMTGADDILRCTRHGRRRLATVKLGAALLVDMGVLLLGLGAFLTVVYLAFGFDDITSAELLGIAFNPQQLNAMGVLGWIVLSGALSYFAMNCCTLFLSAKFRNPLLVLALALAVALLPTVIRMCMPGGSFGHGFAAAEGNFFNWLRVCLPSGGVSLTGTMLDELTMLHFLWIGNFVTWSPYVLLAAAAVQIPLWLGLTVCTYYRHEAA